MKTSNEGVCDKALNNFVKMNPVRVRYFTCLNSAPETGSKTYFNVHTNKLILMGLQSDHPAVVSEIEIEKVEVILGKGKRGKRNGKDFENGGRDLFNLVQGKKKKGGIRVKKGGALFRIKMRDGTEHLVKSIISGKVIGNFKEYSKSNWLF